VYPNPSNGNTQLQLPENRSIELLSVFDSKGSEVLQLVGKQIRSNVSLDLDLNPGTYILRFQFDSGVATKELIII
jgi:hypothetical protein